MKILKGEVKLGINIILDDLALDQVWDLSAFLAAVADKAQYDLANTDPTLGTTWTVEEAEL